MVNYVAVAISYMYFTFVVVNCFVRNYTPVDISGLQITKA